MGVNPDNFYHQQKRVQQDQDRSSAKRDKHGTLETWQIEQEDAERGAFVPDPLDKQAEGKKPGLLARLIGMITGKK